MASEKSGADILVQALTDLGVEVVFGYPGGAVLPIYDAIFKQKKIRHVLVRQEGGAGVPVVRPSPPDEAGARQRETLRAG